MYSIAPVLSNYACMHTDSSQGAVYLNDDLNEINFECYTTTNL